jgi:hypothetical protein
MVRATTLALLFRVKSVIVGGGSCSLTFGVFAASR